MVTVHENYEVPETQIKLSVRPIGEQRKHLKISALNKYIDFCIWTQ